MGEKRDLLLGNTMPYIKVKVGQYEGNFLLDFGTTSSTIDINGFAGGVPRPITNSGNQFSDFDFYGLWGTVTLHLQDHSHIQSIQQAGILGTDFLSANVFTLDYADRVIYRAGSTNFCADSTLLGLGFKAISTAGYYANDFQKLNNICTPNIPSIPVRIGPIQAIAQIDPGYDDQLYRHAVNINQAFLTALADAGITLLAYPAANSVLTTCVTGVYENIKAYRLPPGVTFSIISTDGSPVLVDANAPIFLKESPPEAKTCGGIGTWQIPAAQLGASFLVDAQKVIFDPFRSKVWFYTK